MGAAFGNYYAGRRVLVTGHTGFKGSWLSLWLKELGAEVSGLSSKVPTRPSMFEVLGDEIFTNDFRVDIRDAKGVARVLRRADPEIVFHLAAQPLVRRSYENPMETLEANVMGTANLLEAARKMELGATFVVVTTDKCYLNRGLERGYKEDDPLGGHDVYSASKACVEMVAHSWKLAFFQPSAAMGNLATARAGNVIGGGDYAVDRIIPDCVRSLRNGKPVEVRNPAATRPWQHVLDCLSGYLWLGARLARAKKDSELNEAFNFGPPSASNRPVKDLVKLVLKDWPGKSKLASRRKQPHEAQLLHLSTEKAASLMKWSSVWGFEDSVHETIVWYRRRHLERKRDMGGFSRSQIEAFTEAARKKGIDWAAGS